MAVVSQPLAIDRAASLAANTSRTIFTCPSDRVAIIRRGLVRFAAAGVHEVFYVVSGGVVSTSPNLLYVGAGAAAAGYELGYIVMAEGDSIVYRNSVTSAVNAFLFGSLLVGDFV